MMEKQNEDMQSKDGANAKRCYCCGEGACKGYYRHHGWRHIVWIIVVIALFALTFKAGWYASMKYYGATWNTPAGALLQGNQASTGSATN